MSELVLEKKDELPKGWIKTKLEYLVKSIADKDHTTPKYVKENGIPLISPKDFTENSIDFSNPKLISKSEHDQICKKCEPMFGDLLFSRIGTIGKVRKVPENNVFNILHSIVLIRPNPKIAIQGYLFYLLQTQSIQLQAKRDTKSVGTPDLGIVRIRNFDVMCPPLNEQKRIIEKIDELFSISKHLRKTLHENLLQISTLKNSILQYALSGKIVIQNPNDPPVDIVPVIQKKNTGKKASTNIIVGKSALSVGMPDIPPPKGWKWVPLLQLAELASGHTPKRQNLEYWDGEISWITGGDAGRSDGSYIFETKEKITQLGVDNSGAVILPKDTVCLAREASIGYCVLLGKPMATNQRFVNFICGESLIPKYLMYLFLFERNYMYRFKEGSIFGTIYYPAVKAFHICLPPLNEQKRIVEKIDYLWSLAKKMEFELTLKIKSLNSFEKSILKQAFEGKLVPQDPNDESAEILLQRIKQDKEEYEEKIKQEKQQLIQKQKESRRKKNVK